jgi:hypothetical protein
MHRNTLCYPSWQALICSDVCSSVWHNMSHVWHLWMQVTYGLQVSANEDAIIIAVEWAVEKFYIIHESGLSQLSVCNILCDAQLLPHHCSLSAHLFIDDYPLCCQCVSGYIQSLNKKNSVRRLSIFSIWRCVLESTAVTTGHGIILIISMNVGIRSTSELAFRLVLSGTILWAPVCAVF